MNQATLHQLKVFEAAARHGSFTRAAEELFLTQPTISMQIKQLTKSVGLPLFEQVGKRLYLTEAGRELFNTCRQIFETISQFEMTVANLKGLKQGQLKLAVITTAKYIIPRLLGPFCQMYPGIDISLQVTNHELIMDRMMNNMDDIYIMSQIPDNMEVTYEPFLENPLVVFAPLHHPLANVKNIPIGQLGEEPFIMREPGSGTRSAVQSLFDEYGVKVKVKLELGSNEAIKQAIAGGLGISVLSKHTLLTDAAEFSILDVENFPIKRTWYMVHPSGKQLSIIARTYYDYLLEAAKTINEQGIIPPHSTFLVDRSE
ncbi:LysR family transcriptional regulator [Anabaena sp. FACHB-1237]|uniref:LysR family transcriptional regulator n=1 Tax=Anabaena sp. FACHB-1237 TaxID=2692769 RepID=UPI0016811692|nr:LysR family transcriptional regulator [Anabaena sp. FACHB-1237]MBD2138125.1 LysR family transcriptional regulator [Anabaena sp. FACHB-1237]